MTQVLTRVDKSPYLHDDLAQGGERKLPSIYIDIIN